MVDYFQLLFAQIYRIQLRYVKFGIFRLELDQIFYFFNFDLKFIRMYTFVQI